MKNLICIVCPNSCQLIVSKNENKEWQVEGYLCVRGKEFGINEMENPTRTLCSTVKTIYAELPCLPVRTDGEISLKYIFPVMELLATMEIDHPVHTGEIILPDVLGTGVNIIATSDLYYLLGGELG